MRSRLYFMLELGAFVGVVLSALAVTVFIFNFILFCLRLNHQDLLLFEGPGGWLAFLEYFPWMWLFFDVFLLVALLWMLRTFRWGWRIPALYLLGGVFALALLVGLVLDRATPVNDDLFEMRHNLPPPLSTLYEGARYHDIDDTLRHFGIPLPPDVDDLQEMK